MIKPNTLFLVQQKFLLTYLQEIDNKLLCIDTTDSSQLKELSRFFFIRFDAYLQCSASVWGSDTYNFAFYGFLVQKLKGQQKDCICNPESSLTFLKVIQHFQTELQELKSDS